MTAQSESIKSLMIAMLGVQRTIKPAAKDATNPFYKSSYADLSSVIKSAKEALSAHGVVVLQPVSGEFVQTMLAHSTSGEYITSYTKIVCAKPNDPQAYGSAVTYARRYGLMSMLVLETGDDDGESAMDRNDRPTQSTESITRKCDLCGTSNQFHKPGCPNSNPETRV